MKILKSKKWIVIFSVIIVLIVAFELFLNLGVYRLQHHKDEYWLRYRGDKLAHVGNTLYWSVDSCKSMGIVYDAGIFTTVYGQSSDAVYYRFPLFGGTPETIYVTENIDCDVRNNIFNSVSLTDKSENTTLYDLDAPISAYAFCVTYSGPELRIKELTKVGTISLNHAEIDWLHLKCHNSYVKRKCRVAMELTVSMVGDDESFKAGCNIKWEKCVVCCFSR